LSPTWNPTFSAPCCNISTLDTLPKEDFAEIALALLVAADKYGVETLKRKCELDAPIDADNVVDALLVAESIDAETLMTCAKIVIGANFELKEPKRS